MSDPSTAGTTMWLPSWSQEMCLAAEMLLGFVGSILLYNGIDIYEAVVDVRTHSEEEEESRDS